MYVLPERKLVYLAHPRTASIATKRTLAQLGPMEIYRGHHGVDPEKIPPDATVMTTIRNPWDVFVSWWFKRRNADSPFFNLSLEEFIPTFVENNQQYFRGGKMFYMIPYANVILSYHRLQEEFDLTLVKVGYPPKDLMVVNKSANRKTNYQTYYTQAAQDWVADYFASEIKRYGFRF